MQHLSAALLLLLGTAACRPDDAQASNPEVVTDCLADAGIAVDLGDVDFRRQQEPDFDAALVRCYAAIGVELPAPGELTRVWDEMLLEEVRCLREKGWDVPDPVRFEEGRALNMGSLDDVVPEDQFAAFDADDAACIAAIAPPGERFNIND